MQKVLKIKYDPENLDREIGVYKNRKNGTQVFENEKEEFYNNFEIFFKNPSENDKGTTHVLEHCLMSNTQYISNCINATSIRFGISCDIAGWKSNSNFTELLDLVLQQLKKPDFLTDKRIFDIEAHHEHIGFEGQNLIEEEFLQRCTIINVLIM